MNTQDGFWCCRLAEQGMACSCVPDPVPTPPRAKAGDPWTSHVSGEAMRGSRRLGELQTEALQMVNRHIGSTAQELAEIDGARDIVRLARRLSELERVGAIYSEGSKINPRTGKPCLRWWPKIGAALHDGGTRR